MRCTVTANHKKPNYTKEFKEEAANLVLKHGYTCHEAGRGLGIAPSNLSQSGYYDYLHSEETPEKALARPHPSFRSGCSVCLSENTRNNWKRIKSPRA